MPDKICNGSMQSSPVRKFLEMHELFKQFSVKLRYSYPCLATLVSLLLLPTDACQVIRNDSQGAEVRGWYYRLLQHESGGDHDEASCCYKTPKRICQIQGRIRVGVRTTRLERKSVLGLSMSCTCNV